MSDKVMVGMFRPTWEDTKAAFRQEENCPGCGRGMGIQPHYVAGWTELREHWRDGCYDEPVYREVPA